jgi:ABC-type transport system involved in multi-copper enzyme maturation permease subunit
MNMLISIIIKKDLYKNLQEAKIQVLAITVLCLTLIVSILGVYEYKSKQERYITEKTADIEQLYQNKIYATIHPKAIKAPTPLSIICKGVEQDFGNSYTFDLLTIPYSASKIYESNSYIDGFINLDLTVIFIWLFSIISILIAYDSIARERENGTLKLMFVSRLSKTTFFFSKIISSFLSVAIVIFTSILIISIVFAASPWIEFNQQVIYALLLFFALILLFVLFWISVATFFSILCKSSSQSLVASLAIWIILLLAFPTGIKVILGDTNFINEKKEISLLEQDIMNDYFKMRGEIMDREIYPLIRDLQFSTFGGSPGNERQAIWGANPPTMQAAIKLYNTLNPMKNDIANQKFAIANEKYLNSLQHKIQLSNRLTYFSPVSLFEQISMRMAKTSYNEQFTFFNDFKTYRDQVIDFFTQRKAFNSRQWFTPEPEYYPYSPEHPLCPKDPVNPTEEELDKLREYYGEMKQEEKALDLNDFPLFNISSESKEDKDILAGFFIFVFMSSVIFLISLNRFKYYTFE